MSVFMLSCVGAHVHGSMFGIVLSHSPPYALRLLLKIELTLSLSSQPACSGIPWFRLPQAGMTDRHPTHLAFP